MITGITPCVDAEDNGFPFSFALRSWAEVCDEIVVVTNPKPNLVHSLHVAAKGLQIPVKIRGVKRPVEHNVYRTFGLWYASNPDWVVNFDLDHLISPAEACKLRAAILSAPKNTEIITFKLVTLSRDGTGVVYNPDMKQWVPPYDGIHGEYPFVVNPREGMFLCPFEGVREGTNQYINFEGSVSLSREHWGMGVYPKDTPGRNPYVVNRHGFRIVRSDVTVEHLTFTRSQAMLARKLGHPYWKTLGFDETYVTTGSDPYPVSYPILEDLRAKARARVKSHS